MTLLLVMLCSIGTWATGGTLTGSGTSSDPYVIADAADWTTFVNWINNSSTNSTYASKYYKLGADITISSMAGTKSGNTLIQFKGTFDGDGYTMTLNNLSSSGEFCAPFRYVDGATFKRIHTTGTVKAGSSSTNDKYRTGLVGDSRGNTTITNCWSSVTITSQISGDGTHGGFVGVVNGGTLTINNCLFDGTISGTSTYACAGFVGWTGDNTTNINNSLMAGTISTNSQNGATFMRGSAKNDVVNSADNIKVNDSYYVTAHGTVQGTAVGSMTNAQLLAALGEGWEISGDKVVPVSGANNLANATVTGLEIPVKWTGSVINVSYTVKDAHENVLKLGTDYTATFSPSVVQNEGDYTLTLTGINSYKGTKTVNFKVLKQLNGEGTAASPYLISTSADWNIFANNVNEGNPYSDKFVKLNANDVIVTTMVGTSEQLSFQGTFLGNNKTLTVDLTATENGCAPFCTLKNATIKDLNIAGTVSTGYKYGASLAVHTYGTTTIENCISTAAITSTFTSSADGTHGGFVALNEGNSTLTFTNCVFAGKMLGSNANSNGGFAGYNGGTKIIYNNCLFAPSERTMSTSSSYTFSRNGNTTLNGAFYVTSFGSSQGVQVYAGVQTDFCKKEITYNTTDYYSKQTPTIDGVNDAYSYTGSVISITPSVSYNNTALTQGTDYDYTISPATVKESGLYTITFTGKGTYAGTCTKNFSVAYTFDGEGTSASPYLIKNSTDWDHFAENVTNGNTYSDKTFKLTADITVTTMAGSSRDNAFKGTFDGDGHTMTLDITATGEYCAPFRYASYAKFKRLHVAGTINTAYRYAGGIVGYFYYTNGTSFSNCWSSVTINSTYTQYTSIAGGFVGYNNNTVNYVNCLFDGSFNGSDSYGFGGFAGCADNSSNFTNCLFAPTSLNVNTKDCSTISRNSSSTFTNCYYTEALGTEQGTAVGSMTNVQLQQALGHNWEIKNNKVVPVQDIKNLTAGNITCNTFFTYTGDEIMVTPTVKDMDGNIVAADNYSISYSPSPVQAAGNYTMTVAGNANGYSGTLTHQFLVANQLSGEGTETEPYLINSAEDWNTFATAVNGGIDYAGKYVKLTADITISTMVGLRESGEEVLLDAPFKGTFDGDNHTLTAAIVSTATGNDVNVQGVAPFHYIKSATIKNLTVAGTITSNSQYTGGLVGWAASNGYSQGNKFNDCVVTATLTIGADYAGGLVGNIQPYGSGWDNYNTFTNCVFAGTIQSSTTDQHTAGAMFGYGYAYSYMTNCLENGSYTNLSLMSPRSAYTSYENNNVTSLYYVNKIGSVSSYIKEENGCCQVVTTAPTDNIYLTRTIKGYTVYQPTILKNLKDTYAYNNGDPVIINYELKMGSTTMTEDTDYEVVLSSTPAAIGNYTITFTAKDGNEVGYIGSIARSLRVMEGESLDGYVFATEGEGNDKVYLINDESDLKRLAAYVNSNHEAAGLTFKLNADITLKTAHTTIGGSIDDNSRKFCGTFDGNNKTIKNLTINKPTESYQGLFGRLGNDATVKNVTIDGYNITGKYYVGAIVGYANGSSNNYVTIQNCHVNGTNIGSVAYADDHGGIAGYGTYVNITSCTSQGTISTTAGNVRYGGIIGYASYNVNVTSCENAASITGKGERHGGIVGDDDANSNRFNLCLNTGIVEGDNYKGGIAGEYYYTSNYTNCYYASPCTVKAINNYDNGGHAERGYIVAAGDHIASIIAAETGVVESVLTGKKYYKKGDWTLTLTPDLTDVSFVSYTCEGGTLTNLTTVDGEHKLTITDQDVVISAIVSNNNGVDMSTVEVAAIPDQQWKGADPVIPALTVTNGTTPLVLGTDYLVEGTNNTAIGEATLTLKGINGYKGSKDVTFNIVDFPLLDNTKSNSSENPYLIATEEDLEALASIVNTNTRRGGYYKQTADITLTGEHTAIGSGSYNFQGTYDGDNKTISGLYINKPDKDYQGLFGYINSAIIKNVKVIDCDITARQHVGAIVGSNSSGNIKNCFSSGEIKTADGVQGYNHGGICGYLSATLDGCTSTVTLTGNGTSSEYYGGLVGYYSSGSLKNSFFAGTVEGTKYVGSIAGGKSSSYSITNCYHTTASTGGVGVNNATTGTDQTGAEVVAKISAANDVTLTLPTEATYVWNEENLYKSGTVVTLDYALPDGKVFDHYAVNSGEISNAGIMTGEHTLTGFTEDVVITGTYANEITNLATAGAVIADIDDLTYNGSEQHPAPVVTLGDETLEDGANYTVSYDEGCINVGTYTVTVTGVGRYAGSINKTFKINPFDVSGCDITIDNKAYTGDVIEVTPTVKRGSTTLVMGDDKDYTLVTDPATVQAAGDYTLTITGKGNYTGTKDAAFNVYYAVPTELAYSDIAATSATLTWKENGVATQWTVEYSTDNTFETSESVTVDAATAVLDNLTTDALYYAHVKAVYGVGEESDWSNIFSFEPTTKKVIGSGTATNENLPNHNWYRYALTQQIYTAAEMGHSGTIMNIDFYNAGTNNPKRKYVVYMVNTDKSSFSNSTDWINVTDEGVVKVFDGEVTFTRGKWSTITLDTPFNYDNTKNLAIIIDDNTGDYPGSTPFRAFSASSQAIEVHNDNTNYDPTNPTAYYGSVQSTKNQLRIRFAEKISMNAHGIMTYATDNVLDFSDVENLKAHYAANFELTSGHNGVLTMTQAKKTPAGEGLMLKGTANETFYVPVLCGYTPAALSGNLLVGLTTATEVNTTDGSKTNFILSKQNDVIAWYPLAAAYTLRAKSAYLQLVTDDVFGARAITMDFGDGEVTNIDQITDDAADGDWYTIDGLKLDKKPTQKGVYVTNGHKVVVK